MNLEMERSTKESCSCRVSKRPATYHGYATPALWVTLRLPTYKTREKYHRRVPIRVVETGRHRTRTYKDSFPERSPITHFISTAIAKSTDQYSATRSCCDWIGTAECFAVGATLIFDAFGLMWGRGGVGPGTRSRSKVDGEATRPENGPRWASPRISM